MVENIIIFLVLTVVGYTSGTLLERRHFRQIRAREEEMAGLPAIMLKKPLQEEGIREVRLVSGSVVISIDYFKKFVASLLNFFGGRISTYETLLDRARREAILRMKESAGDAAEIVNIRIETSSIPKNAAQNIGAVEVLAYGTAVYR